MELLYSSHVDDTLCITDNNFERAFQSLLVTNYTGSYVCKVTCLIFADECVVQQGGDRGCEWPEIESQIVSWVKEENFLVTNGSNSSSSP